MTKSYLSTPDPEQRGWPERIVFESDQPEQDSLAPVRIFLGSETAQYRAERVFIYSVEKLRNPQRRYEIYLMKDLPGFDTRKWRTNFTLYRFAIPEFANFSGRAIYNDVDQIYLADPALLFDADMAGSGYMSVAHNDTSVMLIDCAKMGDYWNLASATTGTKKSLHEAVQQLANGWRACDKGWNTRDCEHPLDEIKCLHYTALHTQPWQPTPEHYSYHYHPLAYLWQQLEDELEGLAEVAAHAEVKPLDCQIWALLTHRRGDNSQILNLARRLSNNIVEQQLSFSWLNHVPNYIRGNSLLGVRKLPELKPPWPDIVISSGRRSACVARWLKKQAPATKLIHIGRPWCHLRHYDLIVSTPQYQLPLRDNVYMNTLTLNELHFEQSECVQEAQLINQAGMHQPYLTVVLGGHSRPYKMTPSCLSEMAQRVNKLAMVKGYSVLLTTSPRTPSYALDCFASQLDVPYQYHSWRADIDNPYLDYVRLAEAVVVTADSASMLSELCKLNKPVYVHRLPRYFDVLIDSINTLRNFCQFPLGRGNYRGMPKQQNFLSRLFDKAVEYGVITSLRDMDLFLDHLLKRGLITLLEDAAEAPGVTKTDCINETDKLILNIKKQFADR